MLAEDIEVQAYNLVTKFKRRQVEGSYFAAEEVLVFLRSVITKVRWNSAAELMDLIRAYGSKFENALPSETAIGNVIRRVLFIIRDEYENEIKAAQQQKESVSPAGGTLNRNQSMIDRTQSLVAFMQNDKINYSKNRANLLPKVIESVNELKEELATSRIDIAAYASDLIHAKEIILTYGYSFTAEEFFLTAARSDINNFQVIIVEGGPKYRGQMLATKLAVAGIETTVINDSAVFAIMSRVNKVIIGAHAVMADGGLMANAGTHTIAQAANYFSIPVIVCAAIYKLTPQYPTYNQDELNDIISPDDTLAYNEAGVLESVQVCTPVYDYVPPNLIELFITNYGGYAPSYIYRQLREYYHPDDILE